MDNHVGIYGTKVAEGFSAFQRRSCYFFYYSTVVIFPYLLQSSGLKEVVAGLSQMQQQHNTLVAALDTTRHHIPTRGIHIPDEEDQYHGKFVVIIPVYIQYIV